MILKFKYGEYDDIREEYENLFDYVDFESTEEQNGNSCTCRKKERIPYGGMQRILSARSWRRQTL